MRVSAYLKEKLFFLISQSAIIGFLSFFLSALHFSTSSIMLFGFSLLIVTAGTLTGEYIKKAQYYKKLMHTLNQLDKKYLIATVLETPDFAESEILYDVLRQALKSMNDEIAGFRHLLEDYQDYIETWIHEIKLPISCIDLICENNKSKMTDSVRDELSRIESYVEQALYYARSANVEKDYSVHEIRLDLLVKSAVKKHSKQLIAVKTKIILENLEKNVYCDPKWLDFILGQLISNSMKYRRDCLQLSFYAEENRDSVFLYIKDNGIGIPACDLGRVFEKGFTGQNGRAFAKSTGIGLYLCRQLCNKMKWD